MRGINNPSIVKLLSFSESLEYYFLVLECAFLGYTDVMTVFKRYFSNGGWRTVPPNRQTYVF